MNLLLPVNPCRSILIRIHLHWQASVGWKPASVNEFIHPACYANMSNWASKIKKAKRREDAARSMVELAKAIWW